jgi:hypothetical protein
MGRTSLEPVSRPLSPLARWAFHPDTVQCGLGVLFCGTVPAMTLLVPGDLSGLLLALWVLVPALLLCTRDHWRIGAAAFLGIIAAWLTAIMAVLGAAALAV